MVDWQSWPATARREMSTWGSTFYKSYRSLIVKDAYYFKKTGNGPCNEYKKSDKHRYSP